MEKKISFWIRYVFPFFLSIFLGALIYMMAQFREPPGFEWYGVIWFVGSVYIIWEGGWWISAKLDRQYPWQEGTYKRLLIQLITTNIFGITLFLGTYLILNWYENVVDSKINPLGLLHVMTAIGKSFFIVQIINSVQIGYQLLQTWQEVEKKAEAYKKESIAARLETVLQKINPQDLTNNFEELEEMIEQAPEKAILLLQELASRYEEEQSHLASSLVDVKRRLKEHKEPAETKTQINQNTKNVKSRFLVRSGARMFLIQVEDIIAFYKEDLVLLFTKEGKKYAVDYSLEEVFSQLPTAYFFRINRQCIVHSKFIREMRTEGNQMQVELSISLPKKLMVSQRNISQFKQWLRESS